MDCARGLLRTSGVLLDGVWNWMAQDRATQQQLVEDLLRVDVVWKGVTRSWRCLAAVHSLLCNR
eukprot:357611-Chlamydomonas_euryale.AAC.4